MVVLVLRQMEQLRLMEGGLCDAMDFQGVAGNCVRL